MHTFLQKIATVIIAPIVGLFSLAGHNIVQPTVPPPDNSAYIEQISEIQNRLAYLENETPSVGASFETPNAQAFFETSLASSISSSATSFTLVSATTNDGTTLASSTYGFIIDEGTASQEMVLADCTGTACTNVTRGLSSITGTTTITAKQFAHRRGASVKITTGPSLVFATNVLNGKQNIEFPLKYNTAISVASSSTVIPYASWVIGQTNTASTSAQRTILDSINTFSQAQTFTSTSTFPSGAEWSQRCSDSQDLCNKDYVDSVAIAGASDASQTVKGIVEEATVQEIISGASVGGTAAKLFMTPASFKSSTLASSTTTYVATSSNSSNLTLGPYNITAGDKFLIWAKAGMGRTGDITLSYKQSGESASTTLDYSRNNDDSTAGINVGYTQGYFISTTTKTVMFSIQIQSPDSSTYSSLIVQPLPR